MASSATAVKNMTRRRKAETGLYPFVVAYFTKNEPLMLPICDFHKELCAQLDWALLPRNHFRGAFAREHAKSTLGTKALAVMAAATGRKKFILIIGANQKEAEMKLDGILDALKWPEIAADYGNDVLPAIDERKNRDEKNSAAEVRLANGCYLVAAEAMGKIRGKLTRGKRPDLVILDDPEDDERMRNPDLRKRFTDVFIKKVMLNSLNSELGSTVWLGTYVIEDSPLWKEMHPKDPLLRDNPHIRRLTYNAYDPLQLVGPDNITPDPNGVPKVLWPQRWPFTKLMEQRALIGRTAFNQEFMNDPRDPDSKTFNPEEWSYYHRSSMLGMVDGRYGVRIVKGAELTLFDKIVTSCDPAFTIDKKNDFTAITTWGRIEKLKLNYMIGLVRKRVNPNGVVDMLVDQVETYHPDFSSIEMIALQDVVLGDEIKKRVPGQVKKIRSNTPKQIRIETLGPLFENGQIIVPDPTDFPIIEELIDEANQFPNGSHDDMLDGSAQGITLIIQRAGRRPGSSSKRRRALAGYSGGY